MTEMIDRSARALYRLVMKADLGPDDPIPPHLRDRARVVIEAMREPTEAMMEAGAIAASYDGPVPVWTAAEAWRAMVDAGIGKP